MGSRPTRGPMVCGSSIGRARTFPSPIHSRALLVGRTSLGSTTPQSARCEDCGYFLVRILAGPPTGARWRVAGVEALAWHALIPPSHDSRAFFGVGPPSAGHNYIALVAKVPPTSAKIRPNRLTSRFEPGKALP